MFTRRRAESCSKKFTPLPGRNKACFNDSAGYQNPPVIMGSVLQFPLSPLTQGESKLIIAHTAAPAPGRGFTAAAAAAPSPQHHLTNTQHFQIIFITFLISLLSVFPFPPSFTQTWAIVFELTARLFQTWRGFKIKVL